MVAKIEGCVTSDGRKRAPQHIFGVNHRRPFPVIRLGVAFAFLAYVAKQYFDAIGTETPRERFIKKIAVVQYGVLGTQMSLGGTLLNAAPMPSCDTVVVDPAGLHHVHSTASGAGGASGAIYNWLQLKGAFPTEVVAAISKMCDAKYHEYADDKRVIHVVGPDFREGQWSEREAAVELSRAYRNALHEFVVSNGSTLRIPPISGGTYAGPLHAQLPPLTHGALLMAFEQLHVFDREYLLRDEVKMELCIFVNREWDAFKNAFEHLPAKAIR